MNEKIIEALADFFAGPAVAHNSIYLNRSMPSPQVAMAERFFTCRQALGLQFYETKAEAVEIIRRSLCE